MGVIFMKAWMTDDQARLNRWRVVWRLEIQDAATARPQTCFLDTRNCSGSPVAGQGGAGRCNEALSLLHVVKPACGNPMSGSGLGASQAQNS
jgi:hypothetical protein